MTTNFQHHSIDTILKEIDKRWPIRIKTNCTEEEDPRITCEIFFIDTFHSFGYELKISEIVKNKKRLNSKFSEYEESNINLTGKAYVLRELIRMKEFKEFIGHLWIQQNDI